MGIENKTEFNDGHIVESLDRCHTIMMLIDELLIGHPAVSQAGCDEAVLMANLAIMDIYEKLGEL